MKIWQWVKDHPQRTMGIVQTAAASLTAVLPGLGAFFGARPIAGAMAVCGMITGLLAYLRSNKDKTPDNETGGA